MSWFTHQVTIEIGSLYFAPQILQMDEESSDVDWNVLRQEEENSPDQPKKNPMNPVRTEMELQSSETGLTNEPSRESEPSDDPTPGTQRVNLASTSQLKLALLAALLDHQRHNRETSALHDALAEVNIRLPAFSLQFHIGYGSSIS